jgi:hypothetical protein
VKVHKRRRAAPLHHAIGGNRRIDAAREEAGHAPCRAGGEPTRSAFLPEEVERLSRDDVDADHEVRLVEVDRPSARGLDAAADLALDLRGRQGIALVGAAGRHPEAPAGAAAEIAENGVGNRVDVQRLAARRRPDPPRVRVVGDPERSTEPLCHFPGFGRRSEHHLDAPHHRPDGRDVEPGEQGDLLVVDDERGHGSRATQASGFRLRASGFARSAGPRRRRHPAAQRQSTARRPRPNDRSRQRFRS